VRRVVGRGALGLFAAASLVLGLVLFVPRLRAALRWTKGFDRHRTEPRLYFEPTVGHREEILAAALPAAVSRVESAFGAAFASPFRVYLSASHESFCRRTGLPEGTPVRGLALARDVWISPLAFDFHGLDTHAESLAHELAHLYIAQRIGWFRRVRTVPTWFSEGVADWVGRTGYEVVPVAAARTELRAGRRFLPDVTGRLLRPRPLTAYGVPATLLHAQARLFVEFLEARERGTVSKLVARLVAGETFASAFERASGGPVTELWEQFVVSAPGSSELVPPVSTSLLLLRRPGGADLDPARQGTLGEVEQIGDHPGDVVGLQTPVAAVPHAPGSEIRLH